MDSLVVLLGKTVYAPPNLKVRTCDAAANHRQKASKVRVACSLLLLKVKGEAQADNFQRCNDPIYSIFY
jgi:hypothetical protein